MNMPYAGRNIATVMPENRGKRYRTITSGEITPEGYLTMTEQEKAEATITIPYLRYEELVRDQVTLSRLEAAGVDNWEGYSFAFEDTDWDEYDGD